ncbi:MAG: FAD-dependent oxidoreductase [Aurantimicrobium sp.]|jgi:phytoene dehydrogenase-like protein|nr:FAD-dependent oxidoreductase [Aurantimicrobium sp.]
MAADIDVLIVGGGINGLTAAAYLARSGRSVLVIEQAATCGGVATGTQPFAGIDVNVSPCAPEVPMPHQRICRDLGLECATVPTPAITFIPLSDSASGGVLLTGDTLHDQEVLEAAGLGADSLGMRGVHDDRAMLANAMTDVLTEPLLRRTEARARVSPRAWEAFVESPLANILRLTLASDVLRGAWLTSALAADQTYADDPTLAQNRAFLSGISAGGDGHLVAAGGGAELVHRLYQAAVSAGAQVMTQASVRRIQPVRDAPVRVTYRVSGETRDVTARRVLATVPPWVLDDLLGDAHDGERPEGATASASMLIGRLPRIPGRTPAEMAFGGTFLANASGELFDDARRQYEDGFIPVTLPCIVHVPTLADRSLLPPALRQSGAHLMQVTALGVPYSLGERMPPELFRERVQSGILRSLSAAFGEDVEDLLLPDALGAACVRTWTSVDVENDFGYPGGHLQQTRLAWPFVEEHEALLSPGERWGVNTRHERVLMAGGAVRRAGSSVGLGGFAAAMAVFEADA